MVSSLWSPNKQVDINQLFLSKIEILILNFNSKTLSEGRCSFYTQPFSYN